jgi:hypothetical protein
VRRAKQQFDPVGHYARADIFHLDVRPNRPGPVTAVAEDGPAGEGPSPAEAGSVDRA